MQDHAARRRRRSPRSSSPAAGVRARARQPAGRAREGRAQVYTLAVPTEKENATTTQIELTPPAGFAIDSFVAAPGLEARRCSRRARARTP